VLAFWEYSGYLNPGDALSAAGVEAALRGARDALLDARRGRPSDGDPGWLSAAARCDIARHGAEPGEIITFRRCAPRWCKGNLSRVRTTL
jgi:hypothetical protein